MSHALISALLLFTVIGDVRRAAISGDLASGERALRDYERTQGITPESIEAHSWLARGALAAKKYDDAVRYADETETLVLKKATVATLDKETHLPTALGAAIEVRGQVLGAKEGRASGVAYLQSELNKYRSTSIGTRIRKNINLLSLEGQRAPSIPGYPLNGKPALLFFWAHWCPDCKAMAPALAEIRKAYPNVQVIGPTRLYGYVQGDREAGPAEEKTYIQDVQRKFYSQVGSMPAPVNNQVFDRYGASTTPTIVVVDRRGIVSLYHPGSMTFDELRPYLDKLNQPAAAHRTGSS